MASVSNLVKRTILKIVIGSGAIVISVSNLVKRTILKIAIKVVEKEFGSVT